MIFETNFKNLGKVKRGKVRDIYDFGDSLLIVSTDRLSAFDVIMPNPIPDKGKILNQISMFWFNKLSHIVKNHIITDDVVKYPDKCKQYAKELKGRSMLVKKAEALPIECIVRGYISGSGWKSYKKDGTICNIKLPSDLKEFQKLPAPIFTPSTKADIFENDINIGFDEAVKIIGKENAEKIKDISLKLYEEGSSFAINKGIIIADTKFEFGIIDGEIVLIDEVLTPDSSRFWDSEIFETQNEPESYDKQYIRNYLEEMNWNKKPPAPKLPDEIIKNTQKKYIKCFEKITGKKNAD